MESSSILSRDSAYLSANLTKPVRSKAKWLPLKKPEVAKASNSRRREAEPVTPVGQPLPLCHGIGELGASGFACRQHGKQVELVQFWGVLGFKGCASWRSGLVNSNSFLLLRSSAVSKGRGTHTLNPDQKAKLFKTESQRAFQGLQRALHGLEAAEATAIPQH